MLYYVVAFGPKEQEKRTVKVAEEFLLLRAPEDNVFLIYAHRKRREHAEGVRRDLITKLSAREHELSRVALLPEPDSYYAVTILRKGAGKKGQLIALSVALSNGTIHPLRARDFVLLAGVSENKEAAKNLAATAIPKAAAMVMRDWMAFEEKRPITLEDFHPNVQRIIVASPSSP